MVDEGAAAAADVAATVPENEINQEMLIMYLLLLLQGMSPTTLVACAYLEEAARRPTQ